MKRILSLILTAIIACSSSMMVMAAPKTMPDGGVFDAQYYAATYPDVAATFGTDENLLYQHYLLAGKAEGRQPYAPGTQSSPAAVPTVEEQVNLLIQQENILRQQILTQSSTFTIATAPDVNDPRRQACVTYARQLLDIENQIVALTGIPTSYVVPLVAGGQAVVPTVIHTVRGDAIIAGFLPAYNYQNWNKYTVVCILLNPRGPISSDEVAIIVDLYAANGATISSSGYTIDDNRWPTLSMDITIFEPGVLVTFR